MNRLSFVSSQTSKCVLRLAVLSTLLQGGLAFSDTGSDAIAARYDEIMGPKNFEAELQMTSTRDDGSTRTYLMKTLKSEDDKFRIWFLGPASVAGQEMLRVGDNGWVYIPNLKRASRIANRDSFQGGDFNNADIMKVNYRLDYDSRFLDKGAGRIKVELKAKNDATAYDKIILVVREKDAQPVEAQYFGTSGKMLRSAVFGEPKEFQKGFFHPTEITMKNEISKNRKTVLEFRTLKLDITSPAQRFALGDLGK